MSPLIKPNAFSLLLHTSLLGVLYLIPAVSLERFTSQGQRSVVAIEVTLDSDSAAIETVSAPEPEERGADENETLTKAVSRKRTLLSPNQRAASDLPDLARNSHSPPSAETRVQPLKLKRSESTQARPIKPSARPNRDRRLTARATQPPALVTPPLESMVGLESSTSVKFTHNPPPTYPADAVQTRSEGVVMLRLTISDSGHVRTVELVQSSGHTSLDKAAMAAVAKWRGEPAKKWGRPVESIERLPIRFRL